MKRVVILCLVLLFPANFLAAQIPAGQPGGPEPSLSPHDHGTEDASGSRFPLLQTQVAPSRELPDKAKREKMISLRATAEALKNLSEIYREKGKTDEAVAQLKKIIELTANTNEKEDPMFFTNVGRVYMEIADIYMEKNRVSDAEAILYEAIEKTRVSDPDLCNRLALYLGKVLRKAGKTAEAEKAYQKIIEMNSQKINSGKK